MKEYLKWVTKWMSKEYKEIMRKGIKELGVEDLVGNSVLECTWTTEAGQPLSEEEIQEETLGLILDAIRCNYKFGIAKCDSFECHDDVTNSSWGCTRISLPILTGDNQ